MLTKKGKYGLKAMAHLAQFPPGRLVHVVDIAEEQNIPKRFLNAILFELRSFGFVTSKMGKNGIRDTDARFASTDLSFDVKLSP